MDVPALRAVAALGLLAVVPVGAYLVGRSDPWVALSAVCVGLVVWSLHAMFGPAERGHDAA